MPTYDYQCDACDHRFELFQSITAEPERKCPECGKRKLRRLIGPGAAIIFKGSGFYQTDYRSESYKSRASSESSGSAASSNGKSSANGTGEKSNGSAEKSNGKAPAKSKAKSKD